MRVQGNEYPESVTVENYLPKPGMSEIRLRENVQEITVTDPETETATTMYEYDEYKIVVETKPDLKETIVANLSEWIITLRGLEVNENASIVADMHGDLNIYAEALKMLGVIV